MQILSLTLEEIKSYTRAEIAFTPGTNTIVGANGAGKSTILEAIGFALFDTLPYKQADFVREGAKSGSVTVRFYSSHDERAYEVVRRCGSSSQYYAFDPESERRIAEGKADMLRFLRQHLGADPNADLERLFRDAVGVLQGTLTAAFLDVAGRRVNTFDPLLQVHDYDTAWTRLREPVRALRERRQTLEVEIAAMQARLEQLPARETAVAARNAQLESKRTEAARLEQELTNVEESLASFEAAAQSVTALTRAADQASSQLESARERLDHAEQALAEAKEAAALVDANADGHAAYAAAQQRKQELDARSTARARLREQRGNVAAQGARLQAELAASDQALADVAAAKAELGALAAPAARQQELEQALTTARSQAAQRDAAAQELARSETELKRLTERRQTLVTARTHAERLDAEQSAVTQSIAELQQAIETKLGAQQTFKAQADAIKKQTTELEETDQSICPVCEQPLTAAHRAEMVARNQTRLDALRADYRSAQQEVSTARSALAEAQATQANLLDQQRKLPRLQEIEDVEQSIHAQEASQAALRRRLAALADAAKQVAALERELQELGDPGRRTAVAQAKVAREAELAAQRATQMTQMEQVEKQLAEIDTQLAEYADVDDEMPRVVAALAEHESAYQTVLSNRRMRDTLPAREETRTARQTEAEAAKTACDQSIRARDEALSTYDAEAHIAAKAQQMQQRSELASHQTELRLLEEQNEHDLAAIEQLRTIQTSLTERLAKRAETAEQTEVLEHLRSVLKQAGPYVRRMVIQRISTEAAQIFGDLMQDHARHLTWSEDYAISLDVNGNARQFAQLSGGEQMSAALAVRLALLRAMSAIDVAFFDEPTSNLDAARRGALAQQITRNHGLRQLFVISHDDTFEQATENLIRVARVDGVSTIED